MVDCKLTQIAVYLTYTHHLDFFFDIFLTNMILFFKERMLFPMEFISRCHVWTIPVDQMQESLQILMCPNLWISELCQKSRLEKKLSFPTNLRWCPWTGNNMNSVVMFKNIFIIKNILGDSWSSVRSDCTNLVTLTTN